MATSERVLRRVELSVLGQTLAERLAGVRNAFVDAAVHDLKLTRASAANEVSLVIDQLRKLFLLAPSIQDRTPLCRDGQTAALLLPYNVVSWAIWDCACLVAAGNAVRVRMSERAGTIAGLVRETLYGLPFGTATVVEESGPRFVDAAFGSDDVPLVIAYGSERLGDSLLERSMGRADKKVVYEGPGKDPAIVLEGGDPRGAASTIAESKADFSGQQCVAPEIVLCHGSIHDGFVAHLVEAFGRIRVGDPNDRRTQVGPMGSARVPQIIRDQLTEAEEAGAEIACGGAVADDWVEPTVVLNVTPEMSIFQEESFGPVVGVMRFEDKEEALALARSTRFGLNCMVFGPDAAECAQSLRGDDYATPTTELRYGKFGTASVDGPLFSQPEAAFRPFGGYGKSGWILDSGTLLQGPKLFATEASRPGGVGYR